MMAELDCKALPWHSQLVDHLLLQNLPQSLMLFGRGGDGLEQLCLALAVGALVGKDKHQHAMAERGEHPDLHLLRREESTTGKLRSNIVIAQVRELIEKVQLMPMLANKRVAVIYPACHLNKNSANALLKILEEPPAASLFILGVERKDWLPATIRSRCLTMQAPAPDESQALEWLKGCKLNNPSAALALAMGAPRDAPVCDELLDSHEQLAKMCLGDAQLTGPKKLDNIDPELWLGWTLRWVSCGLMLAMGLKPPKHHDHDEVARQLQEKYSPAPVNWLDLHSELQEMIQLASHPVAKRLLLERCVWLFGRLRMR